MTRGRFYVRGLLLAVLVFAGAVAARRFLEDIPDFRALEEYTPSLTTRVYDIHGEIIAELSIEKRALLSLSDIPVDLQNAVIATEDDQFFRHWGISFRGILRAALRNIVRGRVLQGGSTLTQQLSKLIFFTPERKFSRKIKEVLLALQLERNFSKEEILQFYLNQIYFGHGAYGVQAAARIYFGKDVKQLTLGECAMLAGLIRYPGGYSPFNNLKRAQARRNFVLSRMLDNNFVQVAEARAAMSESLPTTRPPMTGIQATYFVENIRRRLEPKYGYDALWKGGLHIYTTLDLSLQKTVEAVMDNALAEFDRKAYEEWDRKLQAEIASLEPPSVSTNPPPPIQGAFVLLDVKTGAVRAMVGGRGDSQYNRAIQAHRQPGSTFKPFVWGAALQSGMTQSTLVEDMPLAYYYDGRDWRLLEGATDQYAITLATAPFAQSMDFKVWVPSNFDGKFLGVITLRKALSLSRNVASVRIIEQVGPPQVVALAQKMGIRSRLEPVLSLGLGSSVVSPIEMANSFGTFANGGIHVEPFDVLRVENAQGRVMEQHIPGEREAMSPQLAYLTTHLMKGVVEGGTASYARRLGRPLAGKTGTTNENRDLWFVGFTPDLVAGAWMGYDDFSSLGRHDWTGGSTVVPWWTEIMEPILRDIPRRDFPVPDDIVFSRLDSDTGLLALSTCPRVIKMAFIKGSEPTRYCDVDHSQALNLRASFSSPRDILGVPLEATSQPLLDFPTTGFDLLPQEPADGDMEKFEDIPEDATLIH
ncbi:MAG: PBP1A family penicillin-binding protein [Elusimicrobia bacterium]|nr:PBP1A family penicillin-binding protein [Elusimicrobiota bacterium]